MPCSVIEHGKTPFRYQTAQKSSALLCSSARQFHMKRIEDKQHTPPQQVFLKSDQAILMHQSIPSTNIPPGRPPGFCTLLLPRGRDLYLMTFPGDGFLHIHKITFITVKTILSLNWHYPTSLVSLKSLIKIV